MTVTYINTQATSQVEKVATGRLWRVGLLSAVAAAAANLVIMALSLAWFDISPEFVPLAPGPVALWSILGVLGATGALALIARRSSRPVTTFRLVALTVLLVSFAPNLMLLATSFIPGTTLPAVLSLIAMHVTAAGISVGMLTTLARES